MKIEKISSLHGEKADAVHLITLDLKGDSRGFFVERFHEDRFEAAGLPTRWAQINHSRSAPGVLRGLHLQHAPAQGKLVGCTRGRIYDVAVDLRVGSPTFGRFFGAELSDLNGRLLWVPVGFGHGFCVLGEEPADVVYQVTEPYNPAGEVSVQWNSPEIGIPWPLEKPQLSARDQAAMTLEAYRSAGLRSP
jgi:dTDP-4-dehydrorhamnose 3,5-epimerase